MGTAGSLEQAFRMVQGALPDIEQRLPRFTVLSSPPDPDLQVFFINYVKDLLPQLQAAGAAQDLGSVYRHAHALKGAGGSVGFPEISALGERLEELAKASRAAEALALIGILAGWYQLARGEAS